MKFELDQYNRNAPDEELIADLQRVAFVLGRRSVTRVEYDKHGRFGYKTFARRFDGWSGACVKSGLEMTRTLPNRPDDDLFKNLEELWIRLGRQPLYGEVTKPDSRYSVSTYEKRFRGWRNALEAFVSYINEAENSSSSDISGESNTLLNKPRPQGPRTINWRLRFIVMKRDNFKCVACGRSPATNPTITLDVDHIKAWSKGGPTVLENLQTLCTKCNIGKSDLEFVDAPANEVQNVEA